LTSSTGVGGWVRVGLMPNEDVAWINVLVCGPDMQTVAVVDFDAALPPDPSRIHSDAYDLALTTVEPLQTFGVAIRGRGQAYEDPAALLSGEPGGDDVALAMDLTWTTVGTPYQYRLTSRYEIPCTVSGTLSSGDLRVELDGVPGQRDHSWGARDWWGGLQWMWCALQLDDGSKLHAVDARLPGAPNMAIGYLQQTGAELVELRGAAVRESFSDNGLPRSASITFDPGGAVDDVEIGGHAPVRLVSGSGQASHFPRAWVNVTTADGRAGVGWIEWNRLQRADGTP
jgi:hypothetical protein